MPDLSKISSTTLNRTELFNIQKMELAARRHSTKPFLQKSGKKSYPQESNYNYTNSGISLGLNNNSGVKSDDPEPVLVTQVEEELTSHREREITDRMRQETATEMITPMREG